jgi:hypothetical protein
VDADAVLWGDMRRHADFDRFDFIVDSPIGDPNLVRKWVMDADAVSRHHPHFDARRHVPDFFNTGVHFARRGAVDLDRYLALVRYAQANPDAFYGDQGPLNFMVFSAADEGKLRVDQRELQVTTGETTREEVVRRFAFVNGLPRAVGDPVVLHWAGSPKPRVRQRGRDYFAPMTFFRLEFRRSARDSGVPARADELRLRWEDVLCGDWRGSNMRGRLGRLRRRTRQCFASAKVALRARTPDWIVSTLRRRSHAP